MSAPQPRPRHTTLAAGLIIGGSALVVVSVGERLSQLRSLETQEVVSELVDTLGRQLGWSVSDGLAAYRIWLMVLAACAAAAVVLGTQVLRRSHGARIGLGVLAVPLFLGGLAAGGFLTAVVTASIVLLWSGPTALWFRGELPTDAAEPPRRPDPALRADQPPPPPPPPPPPAATWPPPTASGSPTAGPTGPVPILPRPRRPDAVVWACVLTWAFCTLTVLVLGASVLLTALDPSLVFDQVERTNPGLLDEVGRSELVHGTYVTGGILISWAVVAAVVAVLAYRRLGWARVALVASAAATVVLSLLGALSSFLLLLPGAVAVATVVLLNLPEVRRWYAGDPPR